MRNPTFKKSLMGGSAAAIALAVFSAPTVVAAQAATYSFDIPAQDLSAALRAFGRAARQQVVFDGQDTRGKRSAALVGTFTADDGLRQLLSETGLTVRRGSSGVLIVAVPQPAGTDQPLLTDSAELEEVVVTGTNIRGQSAIGAPTVRIDRDYIDNSGVGNTGDLINQLTQAAPTVRNNFDPPTVSTGTGNFGAGVGVDLRGLGPNTTLILINGRRQPAAGTIGRFTDVSNIPLAAIDHIEVLLDGASAIYGSDAIGGVVNIVLKRNYQGAESRARRATYNGDSSEYELSQVFGANWSGGSLLLGYQYDHTEGLDAATRSYAANSDQRPFGGDNFSLVGGNPGVILNPFTRQGAFLIPSGQDGTALTTADLIAGTRLVNGNEKLKLIPASEMHSAFATLTQSVTRNAELEISGRYTERPIENYISSSVYTLRVPSTNPFYVNPFGTNFVLVAYDMAQDLDLNGRGKATTYDIGGRLTANLPGDWGLRADVAWARQDLQFHQSVLNFPALNAALADANPDTAFNPFGDGPNTPASTLALIQTIRRERSSADASQVTFVADGPLLPLPGGVMRGAFGLGHRTESIDTGSGNDFRTGVLDRDVDSAFAELTFPLVGAANSLPLIDALSLSIAARWENYSDFGETMDPRVGIDWKIFPHLRLRGSWGTSFRAPALTQRDETGFNQAFSYLDFYTDPLSDAGTSPVLLLYGVNPELHEERSTNTTFGFDLTLPRLHGVEISATYTKIDYQDRIEYPGTPGREFEILVEEDIWGPVIRRSPTAQQVAEICSSPDFLSDPADCTNFLPAAIIDSRLRNLARTRIEALDFSVRNSLNVGSDDLAFEIKGTFNLANERALTNDSPTVDIVNTYGNPLAMRLRGSVEWHHAAWDVRGVLNYSPAYDHPKSGLTGVDRRIDSWVTADLSVAYDLSATGLLSDARVVFGVVNIFDEDPPYANARFGFDPGNADPYGRLVSLQVIKAW